MTTPHAVFDASTLAQSVHLAIETTGRLGSIAVLCGENPLRHVNLDPQQRSAATLVPEIQSALSWCEEAGHQVKFLSVANGPGSFTGLRIGVTAAKTLAYALKLPLVGVDSLAAIAASAFHSNDGIGELLVGIDAFRRQVFTGEFNRESLLPQLNRIPEGWAAHPDNVEVVDDDLFLTKVSSLTEGCSLAGDRKPFGDDVDLVERSCDAVGVGQMAIRAAAIGDFTDPLAMVPRYLKLSAAEEKAAMANAAAATEN